MKINHIKALIELTEVENKKASLYGTDAYNQLESIRKSYPTYAIHIIKNKTKRNDSLKGLTFKYMETYIAKNGTPEQAENFKLLRGADDGLGHLAPSYGEIKKWFWSSFPRSKNIATRSTIF